AIREHRAQHRVLVRHQRSGRALRATQGVFAFAQQPAAILVDRKIPLHRKAEDRGYEATIVVLHLFQVPHRGRRFALGRTILRHHDATRWIATNTPPNQEIVTEQAKEADQAAGQRLVVAQEVSRVGKLTRSSYDTL